jgi:hypothetical protein
MAATAEKRDAPPPGAAEEWPYEVKLLPLGRMLIDDTYQRPPHRKFIADIVGSFDETLIGTLDVSRRKGTSYAILDGQQRFLAMQQISKRSAWCSIYTGMSLPEEAAFFYKKNRDRMSMGAYYGFRARVVAGDKNALDVQRAVEAAGFVLGPGSNQRDVIGAVSAVEIVWGYQSTHWSEVLTPTLQTIHRSLFGRKDSLHSFTLQGLGRFWQTYGDEEVDRDILGGVIHEIGGPTPLIGLAREKRVVSSTVSKGFSTPWMIARVLSDWYNRQVRGNKRGRHFAGRLPIERLGV